MTGKKYGPLNRLLTDEASRGATSVQFTFDELADLVGGLPTSAYRRPEWWANGYLVQAVSWRSAGWRVSKVDLNGKSVRFVRETSADVSPPGAGRRTGRPGLDAGRFPTAETG